MGELLPTGGEFRGQMAWALGVVWLLRKLTQIGVVNRQSKRLLQALGWLGAFLASFGLHFAMSGSMQCGLDFRIHVPPLLDVAHSAIGYVLTLGTQEGAYNLARLPELVRQSQGSSAPAGGRPPMAVETAMQLQRFISEALARLRTMGK